MSGRRNSEKVKAKRWRHGLQNILSELFEEAETDAGLVIQPSSCTEFLGIFILFFLTGVQVTKNESILVRLEFAHRLKPQGKGHDQAYSKLASLKQQQLAIARELPPEPEPAEAVNFEAVFQKTCSRARIKYRWPCFEAARPPRPQHLFPVLWEHMSVRVQDAPNL